MKETPSEEAILIDYATNQTEMTSFTEEGRNGLSLPLPRCRLLLLGLVVLSGAVLLLLSNLSTSPMPRRSQWLGWDPVRSQQYKPGVVAEFHREWIRDAAAQGRPVKAYLKSVCPKQPFIATDPRGRLGNNLAEYATVFAFGLKYNMTAVTSEQLLQHINKLVQNTSLATVPLVCAVWTKQILAEDFERVDPAEIRNNSWTITYYPHHIRMFWKYRKELQKEFALRSELVRHARSTLTSIADGRTNLTFVGVHVRRTDYARHLKVQFNGTLLNETFYKSAIALCRRRYANVVFVVTSDDIKWCRLHLTASDVYVVPERLLNKESGPERDLAVLAACNHTIFDYGTFGFFGAFLAAGDIITADGFSEMEHEIVTEFRLGGINVTYLDPGGKVLDKCIWCR